MSKKETHIQIYYRKLRNRFLKDFGKIKEELSEKNIHRLRVTIKKLRAFWAFLEIITDNEFKANQHRQLVKPLFKKSGVVRESQINESLSRKIDAASLSYYIEFLAENRERAKQVLNKELMNYEIPEFEKLDQNLIEKIKEITSKNISNEAFFCVQNELDSIIKILNGLPEDYDLHEIRKHFRSITSLLNIIKTFDQNNIRLEIFPKIKKLYDKIGDWHDYIVLRASMAAYLRVSNNPEDSNSVEKSIKSMHALLESQQKEIKKELSLLFSDYNTEKLVPE